VQAALLKLCNLDTPWFHPSYITTIIMVNIAIIDIILIINTSGIITTTMT
jgi:hypothetical protein